MAVPFFITMGVLMGTGGISEKLIALANACVGWMTGGMAMVNIVASYFFGGISGSASADTASIGSIMIPMMVDQGYDDDFSTAVTITSSCEGLLVPPSHNMVIYALAAGGVSIGTLFMAGLLPGIALGVNSAASIARMARSSMLEVIRQDYISTARAKGLSEFKVVTVHALKNALIPVITTIGMQFGLLLGGAVLIESIFAITGVGRMMVVAIKSRNYPVVQGGVLVIALSFCLVNLVVDILYAYVDPRVRSQYK